MAVYKAAVSVTDTKIPVIVFTPGYWRPVIERSISTAFAEAG